ncbi:hypothetical protein HMPREF7215_2544 [Pyramidobacter piscolens W5455]|uniref:Uncharacterized protein n=1 Tax=Pyramidobacter piscolens W5455 TaxID=352165 RepID=A0ABM9ZSC3_9BACT|nr:hypothetical protein HMPREF7215_2544 [Pyramidobacter piscolens W5455]
MINIQLDFIKVKKDNSLIVITKQTFVEKNDGRDAPIRSGVSAVFGLRR